MCEVKKSFFVFYLYVLFLLCSLPSFSDDSLFVNKLPKKLKEELNYYNLTIQIGKSRINNYYLGFDPGALEKIKLFDKSENYIYDFYSKDSLVQRLGVPGDISFIVLTKKEKYIWHDTLVFSESKKTKKIDLSEAYRGYKYLNPIKITIKLEASQRKENVNYRRLESSLLLFFQKKLIDIIPSVDLIVIKRANLLNK
jgi:hypothetical protein